MSADAEAALLLKKPQGTYVRAAGPWLRKLLLVVFGLVALIGANSVYLARLNRCHVSAFRMMISEAGPILMPRRSTRGPARETLPYSHVGQQNGSGQWRLEFFSTVASPRRPLRRGSGVEDVAGGRCCCSGTEFLVFSGCCFFDVERSRPR